MRIILIIVLIYVFFRTLSRYVFPYLAQLWLKKAQNQFYQNNPDSKKASEKEHGKVNIRFDSKMETKSDNVGEYVEYEEVD